MVRFAIISLIAFFFSTITFAQLFSTGQDPAALHWRQIKTENFNIVYPDHAEKLAQQAANMLQAGYSKGSQSLGILPKKITVVFHTGDVVSNAMVPWAPRRVEFATTPPQDNYPQDWIDQIAIHEYRHVVQYTKINKSFTHVLSGIFGEQATVAVLATFVPLWYIEGDATLTETLLSKSGRGRLPSFDAEFRAQLTDKGAYSYDKAVFGSYRDYVPDHYVLGYHIVTMARRDYGPQIWEKALSNTAKYPVMITPFNHGIRQVSGLSKVKLYKHYMHELDSIWNTESHKVRCTASDRLTPSGKKYTSFSNPSLLKNETLIAMRSGIDDIRRLVFIYGEKKIKKICTPGSYSGFSLSAAGNKIVWAELAYDARWENRNWSVIRCYDAEKKRKFKLTHRSRYFSPSLSPDAKEIATVDCDVQNRNSLVILDAASGKALHKIQADEGTQIISPSWSDDGKKIVCILLGQQGKQIAFANRNSNSFRPLTENSFTEISKPVSHGKWIYFSSAHSGIDNIYALDTATKKTYRLTSVRFGAYAPCVSADGKTIYYSECSADGYFISKADSAMMSWEPADQVINVSPKLYEPLLAQEDGIVEHPVPEIKYESKPYRKFCHLLNPHSWGPISVNANSATIKPGLTLMTQNKLSTLFSTIGYEYSINERTGTYFADISFRQWYPVIDIRFDYGNRHSYYTDSLGQTVKYFYRQTSLRTAVRIPLNLSSGKWVRWLQPKISSTWLQVAPGKNAADIMSRAYIRTFDYELYGSQQVLKTDKDIQPRWGQTITLDYSHTPFDGFDLGNIVAVNSRFYFPGIGRHHNFYFGAAWQKKSSLSFGDMISYPRGIRDAFDKELWSVTVNYTLPLCYPDVHLGSLFYLKRLWANLFYDQAQGSYFELKNNYRSLGLELNADLHILRFVAPFTLGGRLSWLPANNTFIPEFLYSINLDAIQ